MILKEAMFGVSDFNTPNISKGNDVLITTILMILFGRPGFYPSYPDLGLNIQRFFHGFIDSLDTESLAKQLAVQCSILTDYVLDNSINIKKVTTSENNAAILITTPTVQEVANNILVIGITTDKTGTIIYNYEIMQAASA